MSKAPRNADPTPAGRRRARPAPQRLDDLGALFAVIQRQRRREAAEAAEAEQRRRRQQAQDRQQRELFASAVGPVTPLKPRGQAHLPRPLPEAVPRQRELDERAAWQSAISDEIDIHSLLETDDGLSFRRRHVGPDVVDRLRRGQWAIQAQVDLHGLRRDEARERLVAFLRDAGQRGVRCVRVIHGKGNGSPGREPVLKGKVRAWLTQKAEVMAFVQARASDGGHGALVVLLQGLPPPRAG
jgi:DNA-nicking Smr family endonuclease